MPESHKAILDERLRDHEANPEQGYTWKEVKSRILKKKGIVVFAVLDLRQNSESIQSRLTKDG